MEEGSSRKQKGHPPSEREGLVRCQICESYLTGTEVFTCPKCRRGPLCKSHKAPGRRECASCAFEIQARELNEMKKQEKGLKSFLHLLQFFFLVFAILFIALKLGPPEISEFLGFSLLTEGLAVMGGLSVVGYSIFYFILYNQRDRVRALETLLKKTEFRRQAR